jgi:hypothetical protein
VSAAAARPPVVAPVALVRVGALAGLAAGFVMGNVLSGIAEIASEPTAVAGIDSSSWTPPTAITSLLFGVDAFHGDFHVLSIAFGIAAQLALAAGLGVLGVAFIAVTQGERPGALGGAIQGLAYALFVQVLLLNLVVNAIQERHTLYEALPQWGWWVASAAYGATLGVVASALFRRRGQG